jgi:histone deacetylase HOS3
MRRGSLEPTVEAPAPTASSIGEQYFKKEIRLHETVDLQSKTLVVIQDACYGHRFSRPRTSKAALSTIVERPERLRASILGLSTAYVRVGKRHAGAAFAPHPDLDVDLLPPPPFQIRKTSRSVPLNSPAVTHVHGTKWMDDLKAMCDAAESRLALNGKELVRPRSAGKDDGTKSPKFHEGDLYLCSESLNAFQGALGGVCEAIDAVFTPSSIQRAFVCIRPPGHHCSSSHPSGFCWLNNVHVGIAHAAMTHGLTHAVILDFDLHHGDGSQAIAWEQNQRAVSAAKNAASYKKTAIGYYSLHDINSYPCEMGDEDKVRNASVCLDNAHGQSIWNVHLEPWKTPEEFWQLYNNKYSVLFDKARKFLHFHTDRLRNSPGSPSPKAAIFLSAGFDASEWEGAGMQRHKVNVPTEFYARFTADVVQLAEEEGLGTDGRIISVLEGGYSDRALASGVLSHLSGLADPRSSAQEQNDDQQSRLASEMIGRLGWNSDMDDRMPENPTTVAFDTEWWAPELLAELEILAYPPPPPPVKKSREKMGPTFFAPTQSSTAKVVVPTNSRKLSAAGMDVYIPLLPDVDWATAAHELWKILIPGDRQTTSCRPEDLNAEASRVRRERVMTAEQQVSPPSTAEKRMQLRERKPKSSLPGTPKSSLPGTPRPETRRPETPRAASRSSRRTTIASVCDLPDPTLTLEGASANAKDSQRRRRSAASTVLDNQAESGRKTPTRASSRPGTSAGHLPDPTLTLEGASANAKDSQRRRRSAASTILDSQAESGRKTPTRASSRPGTSAGPRASREVVVKKTRVSSGSGSSTPKRSASPRKPPPIPKVPSMYLNTISTSSRETESQNGEGGESAQAGQSSHSGDLNTISTSSRETESQNGEGGESAQAGQTSHSGDKKDQDMDSLTASVQKLQIKLKVPSPEENARREKKAAEARSKKIAARKRPGTKPRTMPAKPPAKTTSAGPSHDQASASVMSPPLTPEFPQSMHPQITIQPPIASVAPVRNLPVFTSTSQIPFASPATYAGYQPGYQQSQHVIAPANHVPTAPEQQKPEDQ